VAIGVTLECAGRIALLLHMRRAPRAGVERHGLVGHSEAIEAACGRVDLVAGLEVPVLLTGPTGSGKELIARAIHRASNRRGGPFIAVNAATLPASTAASQLFGHVRGAFTGADRASAGLLAAADGGTFFLDEIGETSPEVQVMLLRALEEKVVLPVGAVADRAVDIRLVAATDADLEAAAAAGRFKLPLLHRLSGFRIRLPSLVERRDDVGRLLVHFIRDELRAAGEPNRLAPTAGDQPIWLPPSLVAGLARHDWPGNVRELRNVARHIVISSRHSPVVAMDETLAALARAAVRPLVARPPARRPGEIGEEDLIAALRANRWRTSATAAQLGISRTTLYALMDRSETIRKGRDLSAADIRDAHSRTGGDVERMAELLEVSERALRLRMRELRLEMM
jgi:two-component system nitrogen regulation response regulator GlnG